MNVTFRLDQSSVRRFLASLDKMDRRTMQAASKALRLEGEYIMTDAKEQTPVNFGTLKSSGKVVQLKELLIRPQFGEPGAQYAVYVHENLKAKHTTGNAKFLENAIKKGLRGMASRIAAYIKRAVN